MDDLKLIWPDRLGKLCMHNLICIETLNTETDGCQADAFKQMIYMYIYIALWL